MATIQESNGKSIESSQVEKVGISSFPVSATKQKKSLSPAKKSV